MAEKHLGITRRRFVVASSVAAATPLLLAPKGLFPEAKKALEGNLYYITNECVGCQTCKTFCPAKAINFGDCRNEIDQQKCIHCGTCYRECPVSAISEVIQSGFGGIDSKADTIGSIVGVATVAGVAAHAIVTHIPERGVIAEVDSEDKKDA